MKLFGRRGPAPPPPAGDPADVDMAKRLEDVTARPARPVSRAPAAGPRSGEKAPAAGPRSGDAAPLSTRPGDPLVAPPDPHVDRLTDLLGPEVFERLLVAESARVRRYRRPASLVIAELVGLDDLARAWGADVATSAVASLAEVLRKGSRTSDYVGRVATHRFAVILTETDEIAAINYVERVREAWESLPALAAGTVRVGFGWAGTPGRATLLDARPTAEDVLRDDLRARPG
jgi:diguanylate cyclase (GGDEF)-like protein